MRDKTDRKTLELPLGDRGRSRSSNRADDEIRRLIDEQEKKRVARTSKKYRLLLGLDRVGQRG